MEKEVFDVLVVDGDAADRRRIASCLGPPAFSCREAGSGAEALRALRERRPDLVILELYLPDLSGLGLCRLLREETGGERLPVIVATARASEIDRVCRSRSTRRSSPPACARC
jgi:DNA-binding response OmpR family regulator